ncbi:MAG: hypothetical protein J0M12_17910, partial [Deltaproteobacteria bacterium]|nr:hypothetical protein [Deltaproteobacteria bacterium]
MGTALRRNHPAFILPDAASAVTIGNFDGLHSGHRALIAETVKAKQSLGRGAQAVVVSFYPHPGEVLGKAGHLPRITTLHQKMAILSEWGVDLLFLIHFTKQFSRVTATTFLNEILIGKLKAQSLFIGPDASVGFKKEGTPEFIKAHLAALGKQTHVLSFVDADGSAISSRRIRSLIVEGEVAAASQLLARPFVYRSRVVRGDQRGRLLGYPTAN